MPSNEHDAPSGPTNPHDALFRRILGEPANAASELLAVLPPALVGRLVLDRLTPVPASFVDEELRQRHSDLLFTAPLDGREAFVYVLFEHQSGTDALMAFRMLRYVVRIWDRHLGEHPEATRLPAVIPVVLHHNRRPWTAPTEMLELIDLDPAVSETMRDYLPRFRFVLDDLARVDERALRARPLTPVVLVTLYLFQRAPGNPRLAADLERCIDDLREIWAGTEHFPALLTYIHSVGEALTDDLRKLIATLGADAEEAYVTTAEMLRAEGEARGEARGEVRGRAEALLQVLTLKFGALPESTLNAVHAASSDQIQAWTARALAAATLEQVLR